MPRVILDGARCPELLDDLEAAAHAFARRFDRRPSLWDQALEGRWTGGQHAEHLVKMHALLADALEAARVDLVNGELPPAPRRGLLQRGFVWLVTQREHFPRGGRTTAGGRPTSSPERATTLEALERQVARYRRLADGLTDAQRGRLWTRNPFTGFGLRWHYTLPEALRVQAQHTRHHAEQLDEIEAENVAF